jgi:HK97 family phage prohead protease
MASSKPREVAARTFRFVASTEERDRDGDVIMASGWDLASFQKNPVILVGHDRSALPVARAARVWVEGSRLMVDVEFPPEGASEAADEAYELVANGYLRAVSVGFLPHAAEPLAGGGTRFTRSELVEISLVSTPSNRSAVLAAALGGKAAADSRGGQPLLVDAAATKAYVARVVERVVARVAEAEAKRRIRFLMGRLD